MKNTGTYFEMRRKKTKMPLHQKLLNIGIASWIGYNVYQIYTIHKLASVFYNAFPALGR